MVEHDEEPLPWLEALNRFLARSNQILGKRIPIWSARVQDEPKPSDHYPGVTLHGWFFECKPVGDGIALYLYSNN